MTHRYTGGCEHVLTHADAEPIDNHACHCSVCKRVTGQDTTQVVMFRHDDLVVSDPDGLRRQPFNADNPDGPLELCTCSICGAPLLLDDRKHRIRAIVPNLMGYGASVHAGTYHAFYDPASGEPEPDDGRPVYAALHPDFVWPEPAR